jgi:hypothetical protein
VTGVRSSRNRPVRSDVSAAHRSPAGISRSTQATNRSTTSPIVVIRRP